MNQITRVTSCRDWSRAKRSGTDVKEHDTDDAARNETHNVLKGEDTGLDSFTRKKRDGGFFR